MIHYDNNKVQLLITYMHSCSALLSLEPGVLSRDFYTLQLGLPNEIGGLKFSIAVTTTFMEVARLPKMTGYRERRRDRGREGREEGR